MSNTAIELLKEFDIRFGRDEERDQDRRPTSRDPRFDRTREEPTLGDAGERDFDGMDDGDDFDFEMGGDGSPESSELDDFPTGLGDVDSEDGNFGDERKVDITDRLKKLLARRGELDDTPDEEGLERDPELRLSDMDDDMNDDGLDDFEVEDDFEEPRRDRF